MASKMQVKIGPSFFVKAKNDYSNWHWAWVRELCQNSIDAPGCDNIIFTFSYDEQSDITYAVCENNGSPMTREILLDKFLSIGESGKNFNGSVGGFGKAKELIAFCHNSYTIHTGSFFVSGSGADFSLSEDDEYFDGTITSVVMDGDLADTLLQNVKKFATFAQWAGTITVNCAGEVYTFSCDMRKGSPRREFDFGKIYTNRQTSNIMVVRIGGIPMFTRYVNLDRCVVLELKGASVDTLTSNRDGLQWEARNVVENFINELATDKKAALKKKVKPRYIKYEGSQLNVQRENVGLNFNVSGLVEAFSDASAGSVTAQNEQYNTSEDGDVECDSYVCQKSQLDEMFIIKNETDLQIPNHFLPHSEEFGNYSKKLAIIWGKVMLTMHRLFDDKSPFTIGFIFSSSEDGDTVAEYEYSDSYGHVYYINPAVVVEQKSSKSRSFKKRFLLTARNEFIVTALHEFVHGIGCKSHDDTYAYKLTDMMVIVMDNRNKFNWCFV